MGVPASELTLDAELFRGYDLAAGSYDEVFSAPGVLRPAWQVFARAAAGLSRHDTAGVGHANLPWNRQRIREKVHTAPGVRRVAMADRAGWPTS